MTWKEAREQGKLQVIAVPYDAWELLWETLEMDSQAGNFDPELRRRIREALDQVNAVDMEVLALLAAYPRRGYGVGEEVSALATALGIEDYEAYSEEELG